MLAGQVVPQQALQGPRLCSLPCAKLSDTLSSPARRRSLRQGRFVLSTERHDFWDSLVLYVMSLARGAATPYRTVAPVVCGVVRAQGDF